MTQRTIAHGTTKQPLDFRKAARIVTSWAAGIGIVCGPLLYVLSTNPDVYHLPDVLACVIWAILAGTLFVHRDEY